MKAFEKCWKLAIMGNSGVGKTAFLKGALNPKAEVRNLNTSRKITISSIRIQEKSLKLMISDIAASHLYAPHTGVYLRKSRGILILLDSTDLPETKQKHLAYFREIASDYCRTAHILVAYTKSDLLDLESRQQLLENFAKQEAGVIFLGTFSPLDPIESGAMLDRIVEQLWHASGVDDLLEQILARANSNRLTADLQHFSLHKPIIRASYFFQVLNAYADMLTEELFSLYVQLVEILIDFDPQQMNYFLQAGHFPSDATLVSKLSKSSIVREFCPKTFLQARPPPEKAASVPAGWHLIGDSKEDIFDTQVKSVAAAVKKCLFDTSFDCTLPVSSSPNRFIKQNRAKIQVITEFYGLPLDPETWNGQSLRQNVTAYENRILSYLISLKNFDSLDTHLATLLQNKFITSQDSVLKKSLEAIAKSIQPFCTSDCLVTFEA